MKLTDLTEEEKLKINELRERTGEPPLQCIKALSQCDWDDGTDFFEARIQNFQMIKFPITYTAGRRKKTDDGFEAKPATEILIFN